MNEQDLEKAKQQLPDIQGNPDKRGKSINKVGIRELVLPIKIYDGKKRPINTVGNVSLYCNLKEHLKGVSMSRFVEVVHEVLEENHVSTQILVSTLQKMQTTLEAEDTYMKIRFTYFIKKKAPVSEREGYINYPCILEGKIIEGKPRIYLTIQVPYTSLCPCSKEISVASAHNQPSTADVTVELAETAMENTVTIEEIVKCVEESASCDMYSILKRPDEKYVTEKAYNNPKFVEDIVRDIAIKLDSYMDKKIVDYVVVVNHDESIHSHTATAIINAGRQLR